jgi:hypothetical protein
MLNCRSVRGDLRVGFLQGKTQARAPRGRLSENHEGVVPLDDSRDMCRERTAKLGSENPVPKLLAGRQIRDTRHAGCQSGQQIFDRIGTRQRI